ncbi:hypothetical protein SCAR479_06080 [Seiridium cardinale]|uniref:Uncharacterized protein n=1 Tax=Seiridium cardinale TaxID=138064 RepID=A0ABR2XU80_9PEZI
MKKHGKKSTSRTVQGEKIVKYGRGESTIAQDPAGWIVYERRAAFWALASPSTQRQQAAPEPQRRPVHGYSEFQGAQSLAGRPIGGLTTVNAGEEERRSSDWPWHAQDSGEGTRGRSDRQRLLSLLSRPLERSQAAPLQGARSSHWQRWLPAVSKPPKWAALARGADWTGMLERLPPPPSCGCQLDLDAGRARDWSPPAAAPGLPGHT